MVEVHEPGCGFESPKGGHTMDQNEQFLSRKLQPKTMHIGQRITGLSNAKPQLNRGILLPDVWPTGPCYQWPSALRFVKSGGKLAEKDNHCHFLYVIFKQNEK